ncbi:MAG TPA: YceI family protein [Candidatus Acidoferrum sp.]|nr:YceI family protein [Candidatus Acidoferrum sp.]
MRARFTILTVILAAIEVVQAGYTLAQQPAPQSVPTAKELSVVLDPAKTTIHWILPSTLHTVHGTFSLKNGEISLDPATGKAAGIIVVDAASGQSGNSSRDSRMHREIIESARYREISFRPTGFIGSIPREGMATIQLQGIFSLHGTDHAIILPVQVEFRRERWKASCTFDVPYVSWGLKNPSNFLLHVKPEVQIEMESAGIFQSAAGEKP